MFSNKIERPVKHKIKGKILVRTHIHVNKDRPDEEPIYRVTWRDFTKNIETNSLTFTLAERRTWADYYLQGYTLEETAKHFGLSWRILQNKMKGEVLLKYMNDRIQRKVDEADGSELELTATEKRIRRKSLKLMEMAQDHIEAVLGDDGSKGEIKLYHKMQAAKMAFDSAHKEAQVNININSGGDSVMDGESIKRILEGGSVHSDAIDVVAKVIDRKVDFIPQEDVPSASSIPPSGQVDD